MKKYETIWMFEMTILPRAAKIFVSIYEQKLLVSLSSLN
jgi:hypothetical protein